LVIVGTCGVRHGALRMRRTRALAMNAVHATGHSRMIAPAIDVTVAASEP
jgi:hypothetical protein